MSARGRGPANAGRGGSSSGRGERDRTGGRGPSSKPSEWNDSSSAAVTTNGWGVQSEATFAPVEAVEAPKLLQLPAAPAAPVGWGGGLTLAERLKKKAVEVRPSPAAVR